MKVILSRKGFDSGYGGYPSIILPNNEMITLPIPCPSDYYRYSDISTKNGECLYNIMKSLKNEISFGGEKKENMSINLQRPSRAAISIRKKTFRTYYMIRSLHR